LEEKHRRWRVSASSLLFFFSAEKLERKKRICAKSERETAPPFLHAWKVEIN